MVSVMMQYSLLDRRPEESCLRLADKKIISALLARGSLAKGLLAGKPAEAYLDYSAAEAVEQGGPWPCEALLTGVRIVMPHRPPFNSYCGIRPSRARWSGFERLEQVEGIVGTGEIPALPDGQKNFSL